jgi:ATP-dependent Clp protease protease subunit
MIMPTQIEFTDDFVAMKKTPAFAEYIHWQELKDRILVINDGIDEYVIEEYIMPIIKWNKEDEGKPVEERKPITIYLNSPGGDIFVGLTLAEVIKKSVTPVHIVVLTFAASMGSVILVAGHKRSAYSYANILIHDGQTGVSGSSNKVKDHMKYIEKKNGQIKDFICSNSKISEEKYESMSDREWWLSADEALELGLIDEIL